MTSTAGIADAAGVSREVVYHHFDGKEGLFKIILRQVLEEVHVDARRRLAPGGRSMATAGCSDRRLPSTVAVNPETQRILLVDGPAVLGWKRWRDLQSTGWKPAWRRRSPC